LADIDTGWLMPVACGVKGESGRAQQAAAGFLNDPLQVQPPVYV
jgi:hypothetical protein